MFDLAQPVLDRLNRSEPAWIARVIDSRGFSAREPAAAVALDRRGMIAGEIFAAAADAQLIELAHQNQAAPRIVELAVTDADALGSGLTCGGEVRLLIQHAEDFGTDFWQLMADGAPCVLVTPLPEAGVGTAAGPDRTIVGRPGTPRLGLQDQIPNGLLDEAEQLARSGASQTKLVRHEQSATLVTALWPTPTVAVVGSGHLAEALLATTALLGWRCAVYSDDGAVDAINRLRPGDAAVVLSHDLPLAGPALRAGLLGGASYVGALGSRRTQSKRRDWLVANGVPEHLVDQIRGPAGLDLGALTPAEIALSITAELLAVRTGSDALPLSARSGPIHRS